MSVPLSQCSACVRSVRSAPAGRRSPAVGRPPLTHPPPLGRPARSLHLPSLMPSDPSHLATHIPRSIDRLHSFAPTRSPYSSLDPTRSYLLDPTRSRRVLALCTSPVMHRRGSQLGVYQLGAGLRGGLSARTAALGEASGEASGLTRPELSSAQAPVPVPLKGLLLGARASSAAIDVLRRPAESTPRPALWSLRRALYLRSCARTPIDRTRRSMRRRKTAAHTHIPASARVSKVKMLHAHSERLCAGQRASSACGSGYGFWLLGACAVGKCGDSARGAAHTLATASFSEVWLPPRPKCSHSCTSTLLAFGRASLSATRSERMRPLAEAEMPSQAGPSQRS